MLKPYELFNNVEWDTTPDYYLCDASQFNPLIEKAKKALLETGGDYMVFWWVDENPQSVFLGRADDLDRTDQVIETIDEQDYTEFTNDDCEIRWEGTHLKVYKYGAVQLFWQSKHTDDKLWCDLK